MWICLREQKERPLLLVNKTRILHEEAQFEFNCGAQITCWRKSNGLSSALRHSGTTNSEINESQYFWTSLTRSFFSISPLFPSKHYLECRPLFRSLCWAHWLGWYHCRQSILETPGSTLTSVASERPLNHAYEHILSTSEICLTNDVGFAHCHSNIISTNQQRESPFAFADIFLVLYAKFNLNAFVAVADQIKPPSWWCSTRIIIQMCGVSTKATIPNVETSR